MDLLTYLQVIGIGRACCFPTLIRTWQSVNLLEMPTMLLFPVADPGRVRWIRADFRLPTRRFPNQRYETIIDIDLCRFILKLQHLSKPVKYPHFTALTAVYVAGSKPVVQK